MDWNWEVCLEDVEGDEVVVELGELESALLAYLPRDVLEGFIKDIKRALSRYQVVVMAEFEERDGRLFINGKEVIKGWESFTGWYQFAVEKEREQVSLINGQPKKDTIWFGFVQGIEEEWGYFSEAELESLKPMVWEIPKSNLPWSGRRR